MRFKEHNSTRLYMVLYKKVTSFFSRLRLNSETLAVILARSAQRSRHFVFDSWFLTLY